MHPSTGTYSKQVKLYFFLLKLKYLNIFVFYSFHQMILMKKFHLFSVSEKKLEL